MTATSDEAALCASIRANPDCDTVRLVYADWLDGQDAEWVTCPRCKGDGLVWHGPEKKGGPYQGPKPKYVVEPPRRIRIGCPDCAGKGKSPGCGKVRDESRRLRAELIRVQVELHSISHGVCNIADAEECWQCWCRRTGKQTTNGPCRCSPRFRSLRSRESALAARLAGWPGVLPACPHCRGDAVKNVQCLFCLGAGRVGSWVRGMLCVPVPTLAAVWGRCENCRGHGQFRDDWFSGDETLVSCKECGGTGYTLTPWARDELLTRPWVCEVPILDREPNGCKWWKQSMWQSDAPQCALPDFLFDRLQGGDFNDYEVSMKYPTPAAARTALARAVAQAAFSVAGGAGVG